MKHIVFIIIFVSIATRISAQSILPWWLQNEYVDSLEVKRHKIADSVILFASTFMYVPYVWGGSNPDSGFDCSGFVCYVFQNFGYHLPRTSAEQFDYGIPIPYTEAEKGDLILFTGMETAFGLPGHVGIVISSDKNGFTFIHTASPKTNGVHISHSTDASFTARFLEIRRIISF